MIFLEGGMAKAKRKTRKSKSRTVRKGRVSSKTSRPRKASRTRKASRPRKASRSTPRKGGFEAQSPGRSTANNELIDKPDKIYR